MVADTATPNIVRQQAHVSYNYAPALCDLFEVIWNLTERGKK